MNKPTDPSSESPIDPAKPQSMPRSEGAKPGASSTPRENVNSASGESADAKIAAVERRRERRRSSSGKKKQTKGGFVGTLRYLSSLSPVEIAAEISDYAYLWYRTRNWRAILAVIPPLCLLLVLGGFVLAGRLRSDQSLKNWYRDQASEMIGMQLDGATEISEDSLNKKRSPEDEAKLDLLLKRVLQLGDENQEARYFVAISNLRQGKIAAARSMLESLAPIDRKGLDLAHAWLAEDLYRRSLQGERIPVDQLRHHLVHALEAPRVKYGSVLYGLLAKILEQEGNFEGAAKVLSKVGEQDPKFVLEPILLYVRRGMVRQATTESDSLIARLNSKINDPKTPHKDMVSAYVDTAKALQLTNRIDATLPLLERGLSIDPDSEEMKRTLSDSYRVMFRSSISNNTDGKAEVAIDLLSKAIEIDPTNIAIQTELALLQQLGIAKTEEKRIALIRHIALRGSSDAIRLLLAESALQRGDLNSAINEYEVVLADKPNLTIALNNLAMLYAMLKPPRLEEARETIRKAIAISPETSEFYDTSGDIESIAENQAGAIEFYLLAVEGSPERIRTREKLAALYEKTGDQEGAKKQKAIATQITKQLEEMRSRIQSPGNTPASESSAETASESADKPTDNTEPESEPPKVEKEPGDAPALPEKSATAS